ncbi:MAG TPA: hypothetical protein VK208_04265 [Pyrinomonadaceae bacterium]|jgi:hypothetical protein|nr:hypothetical protein [Pyrinomonadaceae bacterium]
MGDGGADIIIKGGSVELDYDDTLYPKRPGDPKKHDNRDRRITNIRILDENGREVFNSGDHQGGLKWEVRVTTR